jgi:hypothetical protein
VKKALLLLLLALATLTFGAIPASAVTDSSLRAIGVVSALATGDLTITTSDQQVMSFRLVATTSYVTGGQAATESALAVGESVIVKYHLEANGSLKAKEVKVETASGAASAPVRVRGSVISVSAASFVLRTDAGQELTVRLSPTTAYEEGGGRPGTASGLRAGQRVKVKYRVEPDRSLKAEKVKIELQTRVSFQLEGTLIAAAATSLRVRVSGLRENGVLVRVAGRTVTLALSPTTTVVESGRKIGPASLARGERVHVSGVLSARAFDAQRVVAQRAARKR